jgi:hypothetical protein
MCSGKKATNYFFTDNEVDDANPPNLKRGRIAADTVATLLLQLRKDVCNLIGWTTTSQENAPEGPGNIGGTSQAKT